MADRHVTGIDASLVDDWGRRNEILGVKLCPEPAAVSVSEPYGSTSDGRQTGIQTAMVLTRKLIRMTITISYVGTCQST